MINWHQQARQRKGTSKERAAVNISQLEYFATTVRSGSFTMAAKELFVTPQAVSKAVGDLERELHVQLCEKTNRNVEPTAFGRMFAARASEVLESLQDLEALAKNQAASRVNEGALTLAVSCSSFRGNPLHLEDLALFRSTFPLIKLTATLHASGACLAAVDAGAVDAAVVIGRTNKPELACVKLFSFPLQVAVAADHPLANKGAVRLEDLAKTPIAAPEDLRYCHGVITSHLVARGVEPNYVALTPSLERHRAFLRKERGALLVAADPELATLYPGAIVMPIAPEDALTVPLCFVYANDNANKTLPHLEHYLLGAAARIRRKATTNRSTAC